VTQSPARDWRGMLTEMIGGGALDALDRVLPKRKHAKLRKPTLASVAKDASKAGVAVARYEIKPDGTINVITGQPESATPENPWLADLNKDTK
jgi:hypothetical protein